MQILVTTAMNGGNPITEDWSQFGPVVDRAVAAAEYARPEARAETVTITIHKIGVCSKCSRTVFSDEAVYQRGSMTYCPRCFRW